MRKHDSFLGQEVTYDDDAGTLFPFHFDSAAFGGQGHRPGGGGGGGTTPAPTLVTSAGSHLEFNLIWDSSVANLGSNQTAFMSAMTNTAKYYETLFTTSHTEIINIKVGWG